jgi:hypothetical protein
MRFCSAVGTLVIPWWERAAWWPLVRVPDGKGGTKWASFVLEAESLGKSVEYRGGKRRKAVLQTAFNSLSELNELPVGFLWALRVDFSLP